MVLSMTWPSTIVVPRASSEMSLEERIVSDEMFFSGYKLDRRITSAVQRLLSPVLMRWNVKSLVCHNRQRLCLYLAASE